MPHWIVAAKMRAFSLIEILIVVVIIGILAALAVLRFGPTAATTAGTRPFALPILRKGGLLPSALGSAIDASAEIAARVRR